MKAKMPNNISFATTLNESIYNSYAKNLLDTWHQFSNGHTLHVYTEQEFNLKPTLKNVQIHKFKDDCGIYEFIDKHRSFYSQISTAESLGNKFEGFADSDYLTKGAVRYCYKPFAWQQSLGLDSEKIVFIDADFQIRSQIEPNKIYDMVGDDYCSGLFEVNFSCVEDDEVDYYIKRRNGLVLDTCFLIFNKNHSETHSFLSDVVDLYITEKIFSLPYWHDPYTFYHILEEYKSKGVKFKDLSPVYWADRNRGPLHPTSNWYDIEPDSDLEHLRNYFYHYGGLGKFTEEHYYHEK